MVNGKGIEIKAVFYSYVVRFILIIENNREPWRTKWAAV
jgi:hypothetical protein